MLETDVVVVGGGATGVGVARDLTMRGLDVVLAERGGLNSGTTGRSHGLLHSGARYAESDPEGARECVRENRTLRRIAGACVRETGGYFLGLSGDDPAYFEAKRDACRECGVEATVAPIDEVRREVEGLAGDVERALRVPDAVVYPSRLVAATAADARERGARLLADAPVTGVAVEDGSVRGVTVARGEARGDDRGEDGDGGHGGERIRAAHVVNAAGAWAGELAAAAGADVDMRPTRGVMVAVERELGPVLNRCRPPADGDIVVPHEREAVLGTTSVPVDDPDDYPTDRLEIERTVAECAKMLPALADAPRTRSWWGVRPLYGPDEDARVGGSVAAADRLAAGDDGDGTRDDREDEEGDRPSAVGDARGISRDFVLLDHESRDGVAGFTTVVGGKLTTHRLMAEATADHVCERLGVDADCRTGEAALPGANDPDRLDRLVREFGTGAPADEDVVGTPGGG
jgi:glycerol-3-phosphate dehydrogenase